MAGIRHKARIAAIQALYEVDVSGHEARQVLERALKAGNLPQAAADFARDLMLGVLVHGDAIDEIIRRMAPAWPVEQLLPIDRVILRLAIYEMTVDNKVPIPVVINEAVELAKAFGSDNSAAFINGVLGSVALTAAG